MSSNTIGPFPKNYDNQSKKVRKLSGDLDDIKKTLVTTIDTVVKEGTTDTVNKKRKTKPNVVWKAITYLISEKNKIDTVNKTEKSQAYNKIVDSPKINKNDTVKSRYTQRTDIVNTVDKSRSILGNNLSNISTRIENPTEIDIVKENKDLSGFSLHVDYLLVITPDILLIPRKGERKKLQTLRSS